MRCGLRFFLEIGTETPLAEPRLGYSRQSRFKGDFLSVRNISGFGEFPLLLRIGSWPPQAN